MRPTHRACVAWASRAPSRLLTRAFPYVPSRSPIKQDRLLASKGSGWTRQPSDTAFGRGFGYVRTRPSNLHPPHTFACASDDPVHVLALPCRVA